MSQLVPFALKFETLHNEWGLLAYVPQVYGIIGGHGDQGTLVDQKLGKEHSAFGFALVFGMRIDARSTQAKRKINGIGQIDYTYWVSHQIILTCVYIRIYHQSLIVFVLDRRQRKWVSMGSHDEKSGNRLRGRTSKLVCQDTVYKCSNLNRHSASCCSGSGIIFNAAVERDCYSRVCLMIDSNIQLPDKTFAGYNRRQVNDICTPSLCLHLNLCLSPFSFF